MSIVSRFLLWIGRLYTGFDLHLKALPNQNSSGDSIQNGDSCSNGDQNCNNTIKTPNKGNIRHPNNISEESNRNQVNPGSIVSPISVQFHWPVFTLIVSLLQVACFILGRRYANNGWFSESNFEANHLKRHEIWRLVTSLFVHDGVFHLFGCLVEQTISGFCVEIVHGWKPVFLLYFGGALIADFGDLMEGTAILGCGASGSISALYAANLATIILNWNEISGAAVRTVILMVYLFGIVTGSYWLPLFVIVFGPDVEYVFGEIMDDNVSHAAHIGGVVAGFVFGICLLKNFRKRYWQIRMTEICQYISVVLVIIGIGSMFLNPLFYWAGLLHSKF